jgi:cell division septation protein DedD
VAAPTEPAEVRPSVASTASEIMATTEISYSATPVPMATTTSNVSSGVQRSAVRADETAAENLARVMAERAAENEIVTAQWSSENLPRKEDDGPGGTHRRH